MQNHHSPLKDDLRSRTLRSSSPAIKRPAADMGAQDREDDRKTADVNMQDDAGNSPNTQSIAQANGKRQKSEPATSTASDPKNLDRVDPSEESTSSDSTVPSDSRASTAATSVMDSTEPSTRPTIDEQIAKVLELATPTPKDTAKGYIVSQKWLTRVMARGSEPPKDIKVDKSVLQGEIGPVDNSGIVLITEDSGTLKDERGEDFVFLKPGLAIGEDYQIVPQEAWELIVQWYGVAKGSPVITRYAHAVSEDNELDVQYELNPPIFSFLKIVGTHNAQAQKDADLPPQKMLCSVHTPFMKWLKDAKTLVHTDINTKVRVWKILGGLKSTSASGILTPAASRSSSPAPGAEIVASAGSRMIIDVNTFSLLNFGDQRELIEQKDLTADSKYNGSIDIRTLGLGRSEVIVLEEQTSTADEFPSEKIKFSLKGSAKSKNLTVSGRASPTPSMMTRGRAQRDNGRKGVVGLSNLGNTCYMNSALQCIRSVEELTEYFRSGAYKRELNFDNPLGHHGEIAKAYGGFIDAVYSQTAGSYSPAQLKKVIGKYGASFSGYGQQDSQEFLAFLLDGLQEDLNRIQKKPYIEKPDSTDEMVQDEKKLKEFADQNWSDYKARNDSVVTDLFAGMYKSTLTCPVCDKVSIVFDPFSNLTLQLPIENNWSKEILYFPLFKAPVRIDVDIDKNATILDLKKYCSQRTKHDPSLMIAAESYKQRFFRMFDNTEVLSEANIQASDIICIYEVDEEPTNYNPSKKKKFTSYGPTRDADAKVAADSPAADRILVPIYHRVSKPNGLNRQIRSFFGHASYVVLSRQDRTSYNALFKRILTQVVGMTTLDMMKHDEPDLDMSDADPEDSDTLVISGQNSNGSLSPSASGASVQGEDGIVDVSMRDASQTPEESAKQQNTSLEALLRSRQRVPEKLLQLFDIKHIPTGEGIPTGWNNINDTAEYESVRDKAARLTRELPHRSRRGVDHESYDESSADELADSESQGPESPTSDSDPGGSDKQVSEEDLEELPEVSDMFSSGKDSRGANKRRKQKTYKRKGKVIMGKAAGPPRLTPPVKNKPKIMSSNVSDELINPGDAILLDWTEGAYDALFGGSLADDDQMRGVLTHADPEALEDEALAAKRAQRTARKKNGVSLDDCLDEFGKTETLSEQNAWYCPRCKEHRRAEKKFELWKVPDILVMHFKRFSSARNFRDKLDVKVEYPVEGLDLSHMVKDQSDGKPLIYDLIAVDQHFGGLGGGHYTAIAKNFYTGDWHDYNDSHASRSSPEAAVNKNAYLLFYRRRAHPLGGEKLDAILMEADSEDIANSRDQSPSGEGQRLGGSSHNGSSSASAGQAHRVGGGGLAGQQQRMVGPSLPDREGETLSTMYGLSNSDAPPSYGDQNADMLLEDEGIETAGPYELPWTGSGWSFANSNAVAPPTSNVDEVEDHTGGFGKFGRRDSNASAAMASSTGGLGGSVGRLSDLEQDDDPMIHSFEPEREPILRNDRESAPPPEIKIPWNTTEDDEEDLEVQELRIDSSIGNEPAGASPNTSR